MTQRSTWPSADALERRQAILLLIGFGFAWVLLEAVVGARLQGRYHLMQVVWCRYAVHLTTLVLVFAWNRPERMWRTSRPVYQLTRSVMMLVMPLSFVLALGLGTQPRTIWSVFWLSPLLIVALARVLLGESVSGRAWTAAVLGALAALTILTPARPSSFWSLALPAVMALSFSLYVVMTRSLRFESVYANLVYTALGVFLVLTPFMPMVWVMPSMFDASLLVGIGVIGLVALLALDRSASLSPVSAVAPVLYLHLVGLTVVAMILYAENPSRRAWVGSAIIVGITAFLWPRPERSDGTAHRLRAALSEDPAQ